MTDKNILLEETFSYFSGLIRVTFDDSNLTLSDATDTVRAIETVTTARSVGAEDAQENVITLSIKLRTLLSGPDAFNYVRKKALAFSGIDKVEIGTKTITKV